MPAIAFCRPLLALLLAGARLSAQAPAQVDTGVAVPMRDGVVLRADVYRPPGTGRHPVLVYRTPYDRTDTAGASALIRAAVGRGYAVVRQDVRGRYGSDGEFEPYRHEGEDGHATIKWAARQPWSSGAVGTYGLSYPGAVQWLAAVEHPPALRAMVPAMTYSRPESFWYSGGVWDGSWLDWTWFNIAPDLRRRLGASGPRTEAEAATEWEGRGRAAKRYRPLLELPDFRAVAPWYYEWMRHPPGDPWWDFARLEVRAERVRAPVLNLSGWFDEMYGPIGAVENFQRAGDALVLGPWTHGVAAVQRSTAGERDFGPGAALDYTATVLDWMDRHLKEPMDMPATAPPAVRVFVMGANEWRTADRWPLPGTRADTLYLEPARARGAAGVLSPHGPTRPMRETVLRSDPRRPVTDPHQGRFGAHDYRALAPAPGVAVFETPPFSSPVEILGQVRVELTASASVPDFDLWVQLFDVEPDGTAWNLSSAGTALQRASYRDGGPERRLVRRGEAVTLRMDRLVTANRFRAGHRLRVVVTPQFSPLFSVNLQTGRQEFESDRTRAGEIRLVHAPGRASRIVLPTLPAGRVHRGE